jgi:hypothetical protein
VSVIRPTCGAFDYTNRKLPAGIHFPRLSHTKPIAWGLNIDGNFFFDSADGVAWKNLVNIYKSHLATRHQSACTAITPYFLPLWPIFFCKIEESRKYEIIFLGVPIGELGGRFKISFRGLNVTCGLAGLFVSQRISTKVKIILGRCCYFS